MQVVYVIRRSSLNSVVTRSTFSTSSEQHIDHHVQQASMQLVNMINWTRNISRLFANLP